MMIFSIWVWFGLKFLHVHIYDTLVDDTYIVAYD